MAEHLQKKSEIVPMSREEGEQKKLSTTHNLVSECHKPNLSEKKKGEGEHLVMLATKSEMRSEEQPRTSALCTCVQRHFNFS